MQVKEEAYSSQKRPSNTSEHELNNFFLLLWVIFVLLDPDPDDLQPWLKVEPEPPYDAVTVTVLVAQEQKVVGSASSLSPLFHWGTVQQKLKCRIAKVSLTVFTCSAHVLKTGAGILLFRSSIDVISFLPL